MSHSRQNFFIFIFRRQHTDKWNETRFSLTCYTKRHSCCSNTFLFVFDYFNLNVRFDPDTHTHKIPISISVWFKCLPFGWLVVSFDYTFFLANSLEIFTSHPFWQHLQNGAAAIKYSHVHISLLFLRLSFCCFFSSSFSHSLAVVLFDHLPNSKIGSNALHSRNGSDIIPVLPERYELRRPNKVSLNKKKNKSKCRKCSWNHVQSITIQK